MRAMEDQSYEKRHNESPGQSDSDFLVGRSE
jgi:hypothetical protein